MFCIEAREFVAAVRDSLAPPDPDQYIHNQDGSISKPGVQVRLDCRLRVDDEDGPLKSAYVSFVMCGNCNIFAWTGEIFSNPKNMAEFRNLSNHDSAWRSMVDSYLSDLGCGWRDQVAPNTSVYDLKLICSPALFKSITPIWCRIGPDSSDSFGYRRLLLEITDRKIGVTDKT